MARPPIVKPNDPRMPCPACGSGTTRVSDTRWRNGYVHRRRLCMTCYHGFASYEFGQEFIARLQVRDAAALAILDRTIPVL